MARAAGLLTAAYAATRSMAIALTILSRNSLAVVVVALMITIRFACERTRRNVYIYASVPSFRLLFSAYYAFSPVSILSVLFMHNCFDSALLSASFGYS